MFDADYPIISKKQDRLNRFKFAKQLSDCINHYKDNECLTMGIMGEWGSGKTSIINLVVEQLKENNGTHIINFNPWNFSYQNNLIYQFFDVLENVFKDDEKILSKITQYFKKFISYSDFQIGVGLPLDLINLNLQFSSKHDESKDMMYSIMDIKEDLTNFLKDLDYKLVIIIDDIDRLTDNEIQQIFILVKSLADFPNIIYILSFDKKVVLNSLNSIQIYFPDLFLEKIIQVMIDIPKPRNYDVNKCIKQDIFESLKFNNIHMEKSEFVSLIHYLSFFFNNLRDLKRYINHLEFYLPLMKYEVYICDYLLILALQLFENDVYVEIKNNKRFSGVWGEYNRKYAEVDEEIFENILTLKKHISEENLKAVINVLFPKTNRFTTNISYGYDWLDEWNLKRRICSPAMFDKYFTLSLDNDEISNIVFQELINLNDVNKIKNLILSINDEGKSKNLLNQFKYILSVIPKENILLFLCVFMDIGDLLVVSEGSVYERNKDTLISHINFQLLKRVETQENRFIILKHAIENATDSLWTIVSEVRSWDQIYRRYGLSDKPINKESLLISDSQVDILEELALNKIKSWDENKLLNHVKLSGILQMWEFWGKKEDVDDFVRTVTVRDDNLLRFIGKFITETHSYTLDQPFEKIDLFFDFNLLSKYFDLADLKKRIQNIEFKDKENKKELDLFLNQIDSWLANN